MCEDQAVALSAKRAWLERRAHRSAHIMCSRALSLCTVLQSLRRSHASQVESVQATAYSALGWREVRDIAALAGNAINVSESVSVRVGVCVSVCV